MALGWIKHGTLWYTVECTGTSQSQYRVYIRWQRTCLSPTPLQKRAGLYTVGSVPPSNGGLYGLWTPYFQDILGSVPFLTFETTVPCGGPLRSLLGPRGGSFSFQDHLGLLSRRHERRHDYDETRTYRKSQTQQTLSLFFFHGLLMIYHLA